jgi:hypothetical protein
MGDKMDELPMLYKRVKGDFSLAGGAAPELPVPYPVPSGSPGVAKEGAARPSASAPRRADSY